MMTLLFLEIHTSIYSIFNKVRHTVKNKIGYNEHFAYMNQLSYDNGGKNDQAYMERKVGIITFNVGMPLQISVILAPSLRSRISFCLFLAHGLDKNVIWSFPNQESY